MTSRPEDSSGIEPAQKRLPDLNEEVAAAFGAVTHIEIPEPVELSEEEASRQDLAEGLDADQGS
jgi:hypothetical protein